jgi:hypothetical protein
MTRKRFSEEDILGILHQIDLGRLKLCKDENLIRLSESFREPFYYWVS